MNASAASAAEWLILSGIAGLEGRAQLPMHGEPPRITEPWPRTTGSLLLAWTEARVDAEVKKQGLVEVVEIFHLDENREVDYHSIRVAGGS